MQGREKNSLVQIALFTQDFSSPVTVCRQFCLGFRFCALNSDDVFAVLSKPCDILTRQLFYIRFLFVCVYVCVCKYVYICLYFLYVTDMGHL